MTEQGLVIVKDSFLTRMTKKIKRFFYKGKIRDLYNEKYNLQNIVKAQLIDSGDEFVQKEILDARRAHRKYVINSKSISSEVFDYTLNKIQENMVQINNIIKINNDNVSFDDIIACLEKEKANAVKFKARNRKNGRYNVPVGVIGIECSTSKEAIKCIFKAISTRNSIIILHNNYNKYSTEALILFIVKECLKNFYIDDNIIQMFEKEEIDLKKLDKIIRRDGEISHKEKSNTIYLYQENDDYEEAVRNEIERLQKSDVYKEYSVKPIKGEFGDIVNYLNNSEASAVCMYTNNTQKAYKFINWIDSPNVFVNTGIINCENNFEKRSEFYNSKYVLHEDVF